MKLSEIIEVFVAGDWGNESQTKDTPYAVSCVRGADIVPIQNNEFRDIPLRYITLRSFENKLLQEGDIVIEKSGGSPTQATGRAVYISKELLSATRSMVCSNFCVALRVKQGWNPYFVYQYWQHLYNRGIFFNFEGKTSGIKNLQLDIVLSTIEIEPYSVEEQNAIAKQLQLIEQKIGLNRAINHNLEAMAKQLYDYWFVQFDFPNAEGKPYKSSGGKMVYNDKLKREIPEGWEVRQLGNLCSFRNGINYTKDEVGESYSIVNVRNISATSIILDTEHFDVITIPSSKASKYILTKKDIIIARSGCPGATRLLQIPNNTLFCGFIICCTPFEGNLRGYLTFQLKILEGSSATTSGGSILQNVDQDTLKSLLVAIPPIDLLMSFDKFLNDSIGLLCADSIKIKKLSILRDSLLPLLMNGQVSVNYDLSHD
jgi:restriction endonuclease, S subunit